MGAMQAIRIHGFGGPEALELEDVPVPTPGPGEALVRMAMAGVNYRDVYERVGRYGGTPPLTAGAEGAGTVEAVGAGASGVAPGDRVAFTNVPGAYAQYVVAPADRLIPLPDGISFELGAAFPLQGMTAHYLVHEFYRVTPGTTVLVHAAAGGMGLLLVQMLAQMHARVIGTTSTQAKAEAVRAAGAQDVILYTQQNFASVVKELTGGKGADLVLDGASARRRFPAVWKPCARVERWCSTARPAARPIRFRPTACNRVRSPLPAERCRTSSQRARNCCAAQTTSSR